MLIWIVSLYEFRQFLRIVWWIAIPVTVIAVIITVIMHYRRKKNTPVPEMTMPESGLLPSPAGDTGPLPDWLASSNPDNSSLLKKYEREVRRYKEDYARLEQDFHELEGKYSDLLNKAYRSEKQGDDKLVKLLQSQVQEYRQKIDQLQQQKLVALAGADGGEEITVLQSAIENMQHALHLQETQQAEAVQEIGRLESLLKNMERAVDAARDENQQLSVNFTRQVEEMGRQYQAEKDSLNGQLKQAQQAFEQVQAGQQVDYNPGIQELQLLLQQVTDEKTALHQQLAEQPFLQDMMQESKLQVSFLQNQLEQRIKSYHQLELKAGEATMQVSELHTTISKLEQEAQNLQETLQQQQQQLAETQQALERSSQEIQQQHVLMNTGAEQVAALENELQNMQQQQQALQAETDNREAAIQQLQEVLTQEQQRSRQLEDKLAINTRLLERIYQELAVSFEAASDDSRESQASAQQQRGAHEHIIAIA